MQVSGIGVFVALVVAVNLIVIATLVLGLGALFFAPLALGMAYAVPHDAALARFNREFRNTAASAL